MEKISWKEALKSKMQIDNKTLLIYCLLYFSWGMAMNEFGQWAQIAKFTYWWQVITCYIFYMVPISIFLRTFKWYNQYAYGLVAMGALEFLGYAFHTSFAYPNNLLDQFFSPQNFSLGMAMFFAFYFPLGNALVAKISAIISEKKG